MNVNAMLDMVVAEGGFDTSTSALTRVTVLGWMNDRYLQAVVEAAWQKATVELGPSVAGTSQYAIPASAADIMAVSVGGTEQWKRVTAEEMWALQIGQALLRGVHGAFAPAFAADGTQLVELWPTPSDVQPIRALVSQIPTLLTDAAAAPVIPVDLHRPVCVDGAIATGRTVQDERPDLAASYESRYARGVLKLKVRSKSRVGSGAWQANVAGVR